MDTLNFEDIDKKTLNHQNDKAIKIMKQDLDFYVKINLKKNNDKLIVFSNGAFDPAKSDPPIFMRSKWYEEFNANCLYIDDRTIHNNGMRIGWGFGTEDRHYLQDYSEIAQSIANNLNIEPSNVLYFGSSAGGFMSMYLATLHKGSKSVVNNPQCYVHRYDKTNVERLYNTILPDYSEEHIKKKYALRLSITSLFKQEQYVPETYYIQNRLCETDMRRHFNPLCDMLNKYNISSSNIKFILYNNKKLGHAPIPKEQSINFVNQVLEGKQVISKF